jgi:N-acetyl-gamma-glutamyl-phosphate reductase
MPHSSPEWVAQAVYGLPEYDRADIRNARLVANPGCYPTAVQLGFMPLLEAGVVELDHLVADAKSGVSGAGRKAEIPALFSEAADNFKAYAVPGHRHLPEIRQGLSRMAGSPVGLTFVPHLTPFDPWHSRHPLRAHQAMLPTFRRSLKNATRTSLLSMSCRPVHIPIRARCGPPTSAVSRCIAHKQGNVLVVLSVIDNLVKGAAGQAVQNMNIMFGLPETEGLRQLAVFP